MMKNKIVTAALTVGGLAAASAVFYTIRKNQKPTSEEDFDLKDFHFPDPDTDDPLDARIYQLSQDYIPLAIDILKEAIRLPSEHLSTDPLCGTSNHEGPRLEYLKQRIIDIGAVASPDDIFFDDFGNLVWTVYDSRDPIPLSDRKIIYLDGHSDTVNALRSEWHSKLGNGIDCYDGLTDPSSVNSESLSRELSYVPDSSQWSQLIFGRGSADQLQGVISQIIATKILLETTELGSLSGCVVRSIATVAEEDNDGGAPMHILRRTQLSPEEVPDCVVLTEGTGDLEQGPLGIYIGQRGRCQVEVEIIGTSCHGSMPQMGVNPLEWGSAIVAEAAEVARTEGFSKNKFLGSGSRTSSFSQTETPSNCAVPSKCVFRFDRRMTAGETPEKAVEEIENLRAVAAARVAGCTVNIRIPDYRKESWKGIAADNKESYMGWITRPDNAVVKAAVEAYKRVVTPNVEEGLETPDNVRKQPRVGRWIFSTDGVGYPLKESDLNQTSLNLELLERKTGVLTPFPVFTISFLKGLFWTIQTLLFVS